MKSYQSQSCSLTESSGVVDRMLNGFERIAVWRNTSVSNFVRLSNFMHLLVGNDEILHRSQQNHADSLRIKFVGLGESVISLPTVPTVVKLADP